MKRELVARIVPLAAIFLVIVFLMPRNSKFPYDYRKGREWKYETLFAQFDFPIYKTEDQIREESTRQKLSFEQQKQRKQRLQKIRTGIATCEKEIHGLEQKIFELDELMTHQEIATNSAKLNEISSEKEGLEEKLSALYEDWEKRSEELEAFMEEDG